MNGFRSVLFAGIVLFFSSATADVLLPDFGDLNCDGNADVVDVQMAILSALGLPVNSILDADADGAVDACQDYASAVSGDCAVGQVIKWNGTVWACADDGVGATEPGPPGLPVEPGEAGLDGKTSLIEVSPGSTECLYGGVLLHIGVDLNGNGAIAGSEVLNTVPVCNGAPGAPGEPADPAALAAVETNVSGLQGQVEALQAQVLALQDQVAALNGLATADLAGCQVGESLVKTTGGWTCTPPAETGPGGFSQITHYYINSACKTSSYGTAYWSWAELYPEAQAAGESLAQCILVNKDQATFRWNQNSSECTLGQGSTYELNIGNLGPNTLWGDGAANTGGKIAGINAASYVESGLMLVCWK